MKLVFPYSPKDQDIAVLLASWIRELGGCRAHSVLVVRDRRCDPANDDAIKADLMAAFDGIEVLTVADDVYDKWPESANLISGRITELNRAHQIRKNGTRPTRNGASAAAWIAS